MLKEAFKKTLNDVIKYTVLFLIMVIVLAFMFTILLAPLLIGKLFGVTVMNPWLQILMAGWIMIVILFYKNLTSID